jgi:hypothetical protein
VVSVSSASRASEKPIAFSVRRPASAAGRAAHLRLGVDDAARSGEEPRVDACRPERSPRGRAEPERLGDLSGCGPASAARAPRGWRSCRRRGRALDLDLVEAGQAGLEERSAFCSDSWKVRPIAITSPTDFIEVVSSGSAPGNFSKAKRGILVTT